LEIVASQGATALTHPRVRKAWVTQFGVVEGGLITPSDLIAPTDLQVRARDDEGGWGLPWQHEQTLDCVEREHAIVAGDAQGVFVALTFSELRAGPMLEPYDVTVPLAAAPVRRGLTRVAPGSPLGKGGRLKIEGLLGEVRGVSATASDNFLQLMRESGSREIRSVVRPAAESEWRPTS